MKGRWCLWYRHELPTTRIVPLDTIIATLSAYQQSALNTTQLDVQDMPTAGLEPAESFAFVMGRMHMLYSIHCFT